jgi:MFS family permease
MGRVMSVIGVSMLLAPVLGPVVGGLIVTNAVWHWSFYVDVPIAALSLILAARVGGSVSTAALAGVLSDRASGALGSGSAGSGGLLQTLSPTVRAQIAEPLASAFGSTFWSALGATALALLPASVLAVTQRRERRTTSARELRAAAA